MALWVKNGKKYGESKSKCMATGEGASGKAMDASDTYREMNVLYGELVTSNRDRHPRGCLGASWRVSWS